MKRILVVEDNENNLYLTRFILEKHGYQVIAARDGSTGIELVNKERPDAVLMDIQLPDIDGLEVVRKIRSFTGNEDIPIIAVTSYAMVGDREKALSAGCNGYIEKPINPETFISQVNKYL